MAYPTTRTLYWRTDSTGGGTGVDNTAGSGGDHAFGDFKELIDYIIATEPDVSTAPGGPLTLICTEAGADAPASVVSTAGITTTATDYISVECQGDARHNGISREKSGTGYQLKRTGTTFQNDTNYIRFKGMEFATSSTTAPSYQDQVTTTCDVRHDECLFVHTASGTGSSYGVEFAGSGNTTFTFTNCLFIINAMRGPHTNQCSGTFTMDHCGVVCTGLYGILPNGSGHTYDNTWSIGATGGDTNGDWYTDFAAPNGDYNASEDGTADIDFTNGIQNITPANEFVTPSSDPATADFNLKSGGSLVAGGDGFETVDIAGNTRTGTADIGPFNFAGGGSDGGGAYFQFLNRRQ